MRRWAGYLGVTLFLVAWVNFTVFWFVAFSLDGDAINGKVEDGRYYLANHGRYTEVSEAVWNYSRAHAISTWVTHALGFAGIGLAIWAFREKRPPNQPQLPSRARGGE